MTDEAKTKTSDQKPPVGTPPGGAGEQGKDKLWAGRYKTPEEMERAILAGDKKVQESGREKNLANERAEASEKRVKEIQDQQKKVTEAQTEEQRKQEEERLKVLGLEFSKRFGEGPVEMMRAFDDLIKSHPSVTGALRRTDVEANKKEGDRQKALFDLVAGKHKEDWEGLVPKMREIWEGLSLKIRQNPDEKIIETVYKAAKVELMPSLGQLKKEAEDLKKKEAEKEKAGFGQDVGSGEAKPEKKDRVDAIIEQRQKDNAIGNLLK